MRDCLCTQAFKDFPLLIPRNLQTTLLEDHCHHFEPGEENKLVYTTVFEEYTAAIEKLIESELDRMITGFDMEAFLAELAGRREELDGDVFEMLFTLTDFAAFKDLFVSFRQTTLSFVGHSHSCEKGDDIQSQSTSKSLHEVG